VINNAKLRKPLLCKAEAAGEKAHVKAEAIAKHFASQYHGIGHIRGLVRVALKKELAEIDALTKSILKGQ
jgi:hypothetical protein